MFTKRLHECCRTHLTGDSFPFYNVVIVTDNNLHFVPPVLEYVSPLWHPTLTRSQTERLEAVQRRAIIIFCYSYTPYFTTLALSGVSSPQIRSLDNSKRFFRNHCRPDSCLHNLLPPHRDIAVISRLWKPTVYPRPSIRLKDIVQRGLMHF